MKKLLCTLVLVFCACADAVGPQPECTDVSREIVIHNTTTGTVDTVWAQMELCIERTTYQLPQEVYAETEFGPVLVVIRP